RRYGCFERRGHVRLVDGVGARPGGPDRQAGGRVWLSQLLDRRDHRTGSLLAAGGRGRGRTGARPRHRCAGFAAAHADGGGHGGRRPRIVVGALNPRMLRLAGELADGVLLNYLPASHVPWSVARVREGGDAMVYAYVHAGVCAREEGIDLARRDLFSYAVVDS